MRRVMRAGSRRCFQARRVAVVKRTVVRETSSKTRRKRNASRCSRQKKKKNNLFPYDRQKSTPGGCRGTFEIASFRVCPRNSHVVDIQYITRLRVSYECVFLHVDLSFRVAPYTHARVLLSKRENARAPAVVKRTTANGANSPNEWSCGRPADGLSLRRTLSPQKPRARARGPTRPRTRAAGTARRARFLRSGPPKSFPVRLDDGLFFLRRACDRTCAHAAVTRLRVL